MSEHASSPEAEGENAEAVESAKTVRPGTKAGEVAQSDPSPVPPPNAE